MNIKYVVLVGALLVPAIFIKADFMGVIFDEVAEKLITNLQQQAQSGHSGENLVDAYIKIIQNNIPVIEEKIDKDCNRYFEEFQKSKGWLGWFGFGNSDESEKWLKKIVACSNLSEQATGWAKVPVDVEEVPRELRRIVNFSEKVEQYQSENPFVPLYKKVTIRDLETLRKQ